MADGGGGRGRAGGGVMGAAAQADRIAFQGLGEPAGTAPG